MVEVALLQTLKKITKAKRQSYNKESVADVGQTAPI